MLLSWCTQTGMHSVSIPERNCWVRCIAWLHLKRDNAHLSNMFTHISHFPQHSVKFCFLYPSSIYEFCQPCRDEMVSICHFNLHFSDFTQKRTSLHMFMGHFLFPFLWNASSFSCPIFLFFFSVWFVFLILILKY